jgi:hypothetical protein
MIWIKVLDVEEAIRHVEGADNVTRSSAEKIPAPCIKRHERHDKDTPPKSAPTNRTRRECVVFEIDYLQRGLVRRFGFASERAQTQLQLLGEADLQLVPFLIDRLGSEIRRGKHTNPAGLLASWFQSFDHWRPRLKAAQAEEQGALATGEWSGRADEDPFLHYLEELDDKARALRATLDAETLEALEDRIRAECANRLPAVAKWSDAEWAALIEPLVIAKLREEIETYETWLERKGFRRDNTAE